MTTPAAIPATLGPLDLASADGVVVLDVWADCGAAVTMTVRPGAMLVTTDGAAVVVVEADDPAWAVDFEDVAAAADDAEEESTFATPLWVPVRYTDQKPLPPPVTNVSKLTPRPSHC